MYTKKATFVHLLYIFATLTLQNPYTMTAIEELESLYQEARQKGYVLTKKDFAEFVGVKYNTLSHAIGGTANASAENMVIRAKQALNRAQASGDGSVQNVVGSVQNGIPAKKFENEREWFVLVSEKDKQIDRLLTIIEKMQQQ